MRRLLEHGALPYSVPFVLAGLLLQSCELHVAPAQGGDQNIDINLAGPSPVEPITTTTVPPDGVPTGVNTLLFCDDVEPTASSVPSSCFDEVSVSVGTPRSFFVIAKDEFGVSVPSEGLDVSVRTDTGGPVVLAFLDPPQRTVQLRVDALGTERQTTTATVRAAGASRGLLIRVIP